MNKLPDCPWCSAAYTLEVEWVEMGETFCVCSCCGKPCRVGHAGIAHRRRPDAPVLDVNGNVMDED